MAVNTSKPVQISTEAKRILVEVGKHLETTVKKMHLTYGIELTTKDVNQQQTFNVVKKSKK